MRYETRQVRIGEDVGPIDWSHEYAKDMPQIWHEAEKHPEKFQLLENQAFTPRDIITIRMYDGWPYWKPTPALLVKSPLGGSEWRFFNSYGIRKDSIVSKHTKEAVE